MDYIFKTIPTLAKVTVYDETNEKLTIAGEGSINFSDIANEADVAKDDIVLYYQMNGTYYLKVAETVSGEVTSYDDANKKVTVDGTAYGASTAVLETASTDMERFGSGDKMDYVGNTYTFYLDNGGNVISYVLTDEGLGQYALVLAADVKDTNGFESATVKLLLADGTTTTANVDTVANSAADAANYVVPTDAVQRSTARYTFTYTPADSTKDVTVRVNDSTLFFVRNIGATGDGNTYCVVKGLSNMPVNKMMKSDGSTDGTVISAAYSTTSTNNMVAKAVFVDAEYSGTANYVYVTDSYTGTLTVNGERVYTYPVVFENGEAGTLNVNRNNLDDGEAYEYTVDSNGVADLTQPVEVINGVVSTYAKGSNLTLAWGIGSGTPSPASYTIAYGAQLWNVESAPYAETLTTDMSMSVILDGDGFVKTVFVNDTNVTLTTTITSNVGGLTITYGSVYSGYSAEVTGTVANDKLTYVVTYDNGTQETKTATASSTAPYNTYISVPDNATKIEITAKNAVPGEGGGSGSELSVFATASEVNTALRSGNITINGDWTSDARLEVPTLVLTLPLPWCSVLLPPAILPALPVLVPPSSG